MTANKVIFDRRTEKGLISSENPAEVWPNWQGDKERWLFLSPHDDDIVCGCGITFVSALVSGIDTYAAVVTNGLMGYCRPEQHCSISEIRKKESTASFKMLGLPDSHLYYLNFPDCDLHRFIGRRFNAGGPENPTTIAGASGLQNSFTWLLRRIRPTRVFVPTITDLHPDHRTVNSEMMISVFHAQGNIWPELGSTIDEIPLLYEYATYSNFQTPPTIRIRVSDDLLERKLNGILEYSSQEQIELLVNVQRKMGGKEFIREVRFDVFDPEETNHLFEN